MYDYMEEKVTSELHGNKAEVFNIMQLEIERNKLGYDHVRLSGEVDFKDAWELKVQLVVLRQRFGGHARE